MGNGVTLPRCRRTAEPCVWRRVEVEKPVSTYPWVRAEAVRSPWKQSAWALKIYRSLAGWAAPKFPY